MARAIHGWPGSTVGPEHPGYITGGLAVFDWGRNLKQFKPILEKTLEYYGKVAMPDWCSECLGERSGFMLGGSWCTSGCLT